MSRTTDYGAPYIYNGKQVAKNTNEPASPGPNDSMVMQAPFDKAVELRRASGKWQKDIGDGNGWTDISGSSYTPDFVVTGICVDDDTDDGNYVTFDIPHFEKLRKRMYAGLERPYRVTRVHFGDANTSASQISLLG
jgi:hypothetical protein